MTRNELTKYLDSDVEVILRDGTTIVGCLRDCYCDDNLCYFCICDEKVVEPCPFDSSDIKEINRIKFKIVKINNTAHAQWTVSKFANDYYSCTGCGSVWNRTFDFCPSCGAKMDKE